LVILQWGALIYGRPSNIRMDDWEVTPLDISDFPETSKDDDDEEGSAEIEKGRQTFVQMVSLTEIVADILDQFFTLKAIRKKEHLPPVLDRAKSIQIRLKHWFSNLPPSLSVDDTKPRRLSSVGYLHLAYYTAEVTLHRAILRSHSLPNPNADIVLITREAAGKRFTSALDLVKRLKQEHLQSFWYFSSSISLAVVGVVAGVLAVTSLDEEEHKFYMSLLAEYRWILRISSTGAEFMKYAVGLLDASSQLLGQQIEAASSRQQLEAQYNGVGNDILPPSGSSIMSPEDGDWIEGTEFHPQQLDYSPDLIDPNPYDMHEFFAFQ